MGTGQRGLRVGPGAGMHRGSRGLYPLPCSRGKPGGLWSRRGSAGCLAGRALLPGGWTVPLTGSPRPAFPAADHPASLGTCPAAVLSTVRRRVRGAGLAAGALAPRIAGLGRRRVSEGRSPSPARLWLLSPALAAAEAGAALAPPRSPTGGLFGLILRALRRPRARWGRARQATMERARRSRPRPAGP